jgi:lariat debranching enzyme
MIRLLQRWEMNHKEDAPVDFVLQVGDLEPRRHTEDLATMAAPAKHRRLGDFHRIFDDKDNDNNMMLPWPVYFIGGNHEPWGWLDSGGGEEGGAFELCRNLFFLGRAALHQIGPLRVAALSGIQRAGPLEEPRPHVSLLPYRSTTRTTFGSRQVT